MKAILQFYFLVVILFISIYGQSISGKSNILSISDGISFGFCRGYCRRSINITVIPNQLVALKEPNYVQDGYPPVQQIHSLPLNQWQELMFLVNDKAFQALPSHIGCPDCADGGAEWIEIQWTDQIKRVTFENGRSIEGFEGLVVQMRNLRNQYTENL